MFEILSSSIYENHIQRSFCHHKPTMIRDGFVCFEAQISVEKPTENVEALTDRIYELESEVYRLKETCKGTIHMLSKHL